MDRRLAHRDQPIADIDGVDAKAGRRWLNPARATNWQSAATARWNPLRDSPGSGCTSAAAAISAIARTGPAISE